MEIACRAVCVTDKRYGFGVLGFAESDILISTEKVVSDVVNMDDSRCLAQPLILRVV